MADQLAVWLYDDLIATIWRQRRQLRLQYSDAAFNRYPAGYPLLSWSLPLIRRTYTHLPVRAFIDGLLPEGIARDAVARDLSIDRDDSYRLISSLGRDCAGAIVIQPFEESAPVPPTTLTARHLDDHELYALVANLRDAPLGIGDRVRISLAGVQEKLLLTRMIDGTWGQPVDGTPSTHIVKPENARFPDTVANEAFCMRLARQLGLDVANVETTLIGGRKLIVVERYDRFVHPDGVVERLHQEDFCQATATQPGQKYEDDGGPSLQKIAGIVEAAAGPDARDQLLQALTLNLLIGNGDAHAKNFSLLYDRQGRMKFAPLYDLMSTLLYREHLPSTLQLAMYVDNVRQIERVTGTRLLNEAVRWGMNRERARRLVIDLFERLDVAVDAAAALTSDLPEDLPAIVHRQHDQLTSDFT